MPATSVATVAGGQVEYRLERRGPGVVLMLHGGRIRAGLLLGEEVFADARYTTLAATRPGYGWTPPATGTLPDGFADVVVGLCAELGSVPSPTWWAVAGGPTAVALAARHHELVRG